MSGKSINFEDKRVFYKNKKLFSIQGIDNNKILASKEE